MCLEQNKQTNAGKVTRVSAFLPQGTERLFERNEGGRTGEKPREGRRKTGTEGGEESQRDTKTKRWMFATVRKVMLAVVESYVSVVEVIGAAGCCVSTVLGECQLDIRYPGVLARCLARSSPAA